MTIRFGFTSDWMIRWCEFFQSIVKREYRSDECFPPFASVPCFSVIGNCIEFVTVFVVLLALVPLGKSETAAKDEGESQSNCSADGKCSSDEEGEFW